MELAVLVGDLGKPYVVIESNDIYSSNLDRSSRRTSLTKTSKERCRGTGAGSRTGRTLKFGRAPLHEHLSRGEYY
jgi:hypothetical protein